MGAVPPGQPHLQICGPQLEQLWAGALLVVGSQGTLLSTDCAMWLLRSCLKLIPTFRCPVTPGPGPSPGWPWAGVLQLTQGQYVEDLHLLRTLSGQLVLPA